MNKNKVVSILLAFVLILSTGCSKGNNNKENDNTEVMGEYVEEDMNFPTLEKGEAIMGLVCNSKGQIEHYTFNMDTYDAYCTTNVDSTWRKEPATWIDQVKKTYNFYPSSIIYGKDQLYYVFGSNKSFVVGETKDVLSKYYLVQCDVENNKYYDVTPESWIDDQDKFVGKAYVSSEGVLCYEYSSDNKNGLCFYDLKERKDIPHDKEELNESEYSVYDNKVIYYSFEEESIICYNFATKSEEKYKYSRKSQERFIMGSDNRIYCISPDGIKILKNEDSSWETLIEGYTTNLGNSNLWSGGIVCEAGEKDTFYILYFDKTGSIGSILSKYSYRTDIDHSSEKELTIYSLFESSAVTYGITNYKKEHPDVKIYYKILNNRDGSILLSDEIKNMNTEILAGKGPDIILLDNLPLESFVEKGVLLDTSDIFLDMIKNNELNQNIAENYVTDGKVYAMPLRFFIPIYTFREDFDPSSVAAVEQLSQTIDQPLFELNTYTSLTKKFFYLYADQMINEEGYIDKEALREFLQNVKSIGDQSKAEVINDTEGMDSTAYISTNNDNLMKLFFDGYNQVFDGNGYADMSYLSKKTDLWNDVWCMKEFNGSLRTVNDMFIPSSIVGINNAAKHKEIAIDFVKSLYEEEIQSKDMNEGFPMNSKALEQWLTIGDTYQKKHFSFTNTNGEKFEIKIDDTTFDSTTINDTREMILSLSKPAMNDTVLLDIITKGSISYFNGEQSLEQVTDAIINRANIYVGE